MNEELYDIVFEQSVLNSIIFEPKQFKEINKKLHVEDFYQPYHQDIYKAMKDLFITDEPIDEEFLRKQLEKVGKFDEKIMIEILSANAISNIDAYVNEVKSKSNRRKLLEISTALKISALDINIDPLTTSTVLQASLQKGITRVEPILNLISLSHVIDKDMTFILNEWLPMPAGAVTFLTAKGGVGKSFVAIQAALRYLNKHQDKKVFLWLSEDPITVSKNRAMDVCKDYDQDIRLLERLIITDSIPTHFTRLDKTTQVVASAFYEVVAQLKEFDFIVFDPLIAFFGGDENNNSQARQFMQLFTKWAADEDKTILFIHHVAKREATSRGAGAFIDAVRLQYTVDKIYTDDKKKELNNEKKMCLEFEVAKDNYGVKNIVKGRFERKIFPKSRPVVVFSSIQDEKDLGGTR